MSKIKLSKSYTDFLQEIKSRIRSAQYEALKAVNKNMSIIQNYNQWFQKLVGLNGATALKRQVLNTKNPLIPH